MSMFEEVSAEELAAVRASAAAKPNSRSYSERMHEYDEALKALVPGKTLRRKLNIVTAPEGADEAAIAAAAKASDSPRGEFLRLARATKRTGIRVNSFELDGYIYFELAPAPADGETPAEPKPRRTRVATPAVEADAAS